MTPCANDNWVRRFIVSDPRKHGNGFTVYKVTSIVFPKGSPEAVTKVIVWKRYNDFKKLHNELLQKHKKLYLQGKFPSFAEAKFFRRFEDEVIEERRKCATVLLEFIGAHPPLFTSSVFIKFFESGYSLDDCRDSSCSTDRDNNSTSETTVVSQQEVVSVGSSDGSHAKRNGESGPLLKLGGTWQYPQASDSISLSSHSSEEEHTSFTDTDSVQSSVLQTTESVVSPTKTTPNIWEPQQREEFSEISDVQISSPESSLLIGDQDYVAQAQRHVTLALRHEAAGAHDAAFSLLKIGISCLLTGVQDETDTERRRSVRKKTCEYLVAAEKLYNEHLMPKFPIASEHCASQKSIACSLPGLEAFKVLGIIDKVMLAMSTVEDQCYIVKVLYKSPCPVNKTQVPILPRNVPYMVKLHFYFETESSVFLFLQHASGGRLWDHIRSYLQSQPTTPVHLFTKGNVYLGRKLIQESPTVLSDKPTTSEELPASESCVPFVQNCEKTCVSLETVNGKESKAKHIIRKEIESGEDGNVEVFQNICNGPKESDLSLTEDVSTSNEVPKFDPKSLEHLETTELMNNAKRLLSSVNETLLRSGLADCKANGEPAGLKLKTAEENTASTQKPYLKHLPVRQRSGTRMEPRRRSSDDLFDWRPHSTCGSSAREWERPIPCIPEGHVRQWAEQLVVCLAALHESGLVYRDLHPKNVLLAEDGRLLLSYSCCWPSVDSLVNREAVEKLYAAPELTSIFEPSSAVDWWSLGALLYELITGKPLYLSQPGGIHSHSIINFPDFVSKEAQSLLTELLRYYPQERLGAGVGGIDEIKSHPFFANTDWSSVKMAGLQT